MVRSEQKYITAYCIFRVNPNPTIEVVRKNLKWPALTGDKAVATPTESSCKEATPSEIE
jgi:hypothetical protein